MIEQLEENSYLKSAALVAARFNLDPVVVLKSDYFEWSVRIAAANYVSHVEAEAQAKTSTKSTSNGSKVTAPSWMG